MKKTWCNAKWRERVARTERVRPRTTKIIFSLTRLRCEAENSSRRKRDCRCSRGDAERSGIFWRCRFVTRFLRVCRIFKDNYTSFNIITRDYAREELSRISIRRRRNLLKKKALKYSVCTRKVSSSILREREERERGRVYILKY